MKLVLSKAVKGIVHGTNEIRLHASAGDVLFVLFKNPTYYRCDSLNYPNTDIIVFKNQVEREIEDGISLDEETSFSEDFPISGSDIPGDLGEIIEGGSDSIGYGN